MSLTGRQTTGVVVSCATGWASQEFHRKKNPPLSPTPGATHERTERIFFRPRLFQSHTTDGGRWTHARTHAHTPAHLHTTQPLTGNLCAGATHTARRRQTRHKINNIMECVCWGAGRGRTVSWILTHLHTHCARRPVFLCPKTGKRVWTTKKQTLSVSVWLFLLCPPPLPEMATANSGNARVRNSKLGQGKFEHCSTAPTLHCTPTLHTHTAHPHCTLHTAHCTALHCTEEQPSVGGAHAHRSQDTNTHTANMQPRKGAVGLDGEMSRLVELLEAASEELTKKVFFFFFCGAW